MTDDKFTVQAAVDGKLDLSDLRMDPATLAHQAVVAGRAATRSWPRTSCAQRNWRHWTAKR